MRIRYWLIIFLFSFSMIIAGQETSTQSGNSAGEDFNIDELFEKFLVTPLNFQDKEAFQNSMELLSQSIKILKIKSNVKISAYAVAAIL